MSFRPLLLVPLLSVLASCGVGDDSVSVVQSGSAIARKNFKLTAVSDPQAIGLAKVDYRIEFTGNGPVKGKVFTTINPLGDNYVPTHPLHAKDLCENLEYAGVATGWRLPTTSELETIRKLDFTTLGYQGQALPVEGAVWTQQDVTTKKVERYVSGGYYYYHFEATLSYFEMTGRLVNSGGAKTWVYASGETSDQASIDNAMPLFVAGQVDSDKSLQYLCVHAPL